MSRWKRIPEIARYRITDEGRLFVFCSGSKGKGDFWRNLRLDTRRFGSVRVNTVDYHEAITVCLAIVQDEDFQSVNDAMIAGYSRGGAVAPILASLLSFEYAKRRTRHLSHVIMLYAPKRAGNRQFVATRINAAVTMKAVAFRGDIIPFLPPWPWYRQFPVVWRKSRLIDRLPWRAHMRSAASAAGFRHEMGKM